MGLYGDQFTDKVAIITGAGGGIGQVYAESLAREGAAVVVADINVEGAKKVADGIKGEGGSALAVRVDVSDPESAKDMAAQTLSEFGWHRLPGQQRRDLRWDEARLPGLRSTGTTTRSS